MLLQYQKEEIYLVVFLLAKSLPIISGLVAKNWPSLINVVPMPSRALHSFLPGVSALFIIFLVDPKTGISKKFYKQYRKIVNCWIVSIAPDVTVF